MVMVELYKTVEVDGEKTIKTCKARGDQVSIMKKAGWGDKKPVLATAPKKDIDKK